MLNNIINKIITFFSLMWSWIGHLWMPIWQCILQNPMNMLLIIGGIIALFILGIFLQIVSWKKYNILDELEEMDKFPAGFFWAAMIMRIFYPLLTAYISMTFIKSTTSAGGFTSYLAGVTYHFNNYAQWLRHDQIIGGVVLLEFFILSFLCIIRLKPLRLIRYWIHTIDFALIGYIIGNLYLLLLNLAESNLFASLVIGLLGIILDIAVPFIFSVSALAPVYCFVLTLLAPILRFFGCFEVNFELENGKVCRGNTLLLFIDQMLP